MTGKFRIDVRADWRVSGKSFSGTPLMHCIAPGQSQTDWQTEKALAVSQLKDLIDAINKAGGLTFLMEMHSVAMVFPNHRDIDFISLQFKTWDPPKGNDGTMMTTTCKDLKVTGVMPLTAHLVALAKAKYITLDMDVGKTQVVTLLTKQKFSIS
jgi:hypothetical protein